MSDALTETLLRRERILARVAQQRAGIGSAFVGLKGPIEVVDQVLRAGRVLRAHPATVTVLVAAIVVLRARTLVGMATRAYGIWQVLRRARAVLSRLQK